MMCFLELKKRDYQREHRENHGGHREMINLMLKTNKKSRVYFLELKERDYHRVHRDRTECTEKEIIYG